jgi:hypothetical protein
MSGDGIAQMNTRSHVHQRRNARRRTMDMLLTGGWER